MDIAGMMGFFCLRLGAIFLGIPNFKILRFQKKNLFLVCVLRCQYV